MTVQEAITQCDLMKPNQYEDGLKIKWLGEVEGMVYDMAVNRKCPDISFHEFDSETDYERKLIAPDRYASLYVYYLMAMIDFSNAETERYNNDMVMFNTAFTEFSNYWYSTYPQKSDGQIYNL